MTTQDARPGERDTSTVRLRSAPALTPRLLLGALRSPAKKPHPGAAVPPTRLVLPGVRADADRLAAYERVCGFPDDGRGTLPITYPHVLGFPLAMRLMGARAFPLPLLGLVHTSVTITRYAPVPAAGTYELAVRVAGLAPHRRGTEAAVVTELRDGADLVWTSESSYLARHRTEPGTHEPRPAAARVPLPAVADWRLGGDLGRRYGAASGDRNPIHLHPLTARLFGFPRAIAHGMWTAARCLAEHGTPPETSVHAEFRAPVLLPGTVTYAAAEGAFELRGGEPGEERVHVTGSVAPPGG
ncbi:MaoC/PaaZ C-terminal domain-containing protein [Streptomyces sp. NPDC008150]|uniref:MaoC/PaaZ C-terminal domain-containing protein n=1 Tax=Streptomyces sp. NPDC008150 TaxID=3364816 RepID=UPI0036E693FC